jgi:hypothetical protein
MALMRSTLLFCMCLSYATCFQCAEHERPFGETECQCEAGYSRQGALCEACPIATFKEYSGDSAENGPACALLSGCCMCMSNTITLASAAVHSSSCLCRPGHGGHACLPCSVGLFKTSTGGAECERCPEGASTAEQRSSAAEGLHSSARPLRQLRRWLQQVRKRLVRSHLRHERMHTMSSRRDISSRSN